MNISEAKRQIMKRRGINKAANTEGLIIAMLPSAMLEDEVETLEPLQTAIRHTSGLSCKPSICYATLVESPRPSRELMPVFDNGDDVEAEDYVLDFKPGWRYRLLVAPDSGMHRSSSSGTISDEPFRLRRIKLGMPMLYEDVDLATLGFRQGILGCVIGIIHIAGVITHFIWNAGWKK